ncbi:MAG TPA: hypothetical protein VNU97_12430 [Rhizomicrobium sp.]|jgi:hypothetical protein|nr:hypothetical protein [Rhizomicrobium sp.]
MNEPSSPLADGALSLAELRAHGVKPQDIDSNWMDDMVNRLFTELKRELAQLENAKPKVQHDRQDAAVRATNARTLDSLQRTLERLNRMEADRSARNATRGTINADEARARLEPRILEIVARIRELRHREGLDQ